MLDTNQLALRREEAIALIEELQDAVGRLKRVRERLAVLLEDHRSGPWWTPP